MVGRDQDLALLVPEHGVRRRVARPVQHLQRAVAKLERLAVLQRSRDLRLRPPRAKCRGHCLQRPHDLVGDAVAAHHASRELVVARGVLAVVLGEVGELVDRGDLGARVRDDDVDEPEVVDVLVGEDHELDVLERAPPLGELVLELVEGAAGVRAPSRPA